MSADNTIAVLKSPKVNGFEYRVLHAQAIENIYWNDEKKNFNENNEVDAKNLVEYFGACEIFTDEDEAYRKARETEQEILNDDFCPILEYGISTITISKPFSWYEERLGIIQKPTSEEEFIKDISV